jgi:hypothetical protein
VTDSFTIMLPLFCRYQKSQCSITIGFRAENVLTSYRKSYQRNPEINSYLIFELYFKVKPMSHCLFKTYND